MIELQELLQIKKKYIENQINSIKSFINQAPEGTLRISLVKKNPQYYWRKDNKDTCGIYIKK